MQMCGRLDELDGEENGAWAQALAVMFALASAARHLPHPTRWTWTAALRARGFRPPVRRAFWLRLMQSAGLLDALPGRGFRPTALLPAWFERPAERQARDLVEAWVCLPETLRCRQDRRRIVRKLGHPLGPQPLAPSEARQLSALRLLGIWEEGAGGLTRLGRAALQGPPRGPKPASRAASHGAAWQIDAFSAWVSPTQQARSRALLWELEAFLPPYAPGRYLLTPPALRCAAQYGSLAELAGLLERGAGAPLAPELRARILGLPQARLLSGSVLEFDSPAELAMLRRRPALRRRLDRLLSPRHVYLPAHAQAQTLAALARAGLPVLPPPTAAPEAAPPTLVPGEAADLLALALAAQELDLGLGCPAELVEKLSAMLPAGLLQAARRRAERALHARRAPPPYGPPAGPGSVPPGRIAALQRAADQEDALTVWYWPAGAARAEQRRITPLLIEQRGLGVYLQAYCHRRRANRTFRLDRLLLEEELPGDHGPAP